MSEQNKALVKRFYTEVFDKKNAAALDALCTADFVSHGAMPGQAPGLAGVKETFKLMFSAFPDFKTNIEEIVAERDIVVTRFSGTATHKGEMMGAKPTGKKVTFHAIDMLRIKNGKISDAWHQGDEMMVMAGLGAKPPAA